jgi:2-Cys peroxiredoxin 5
MKAWGDNLDPAQETDVSLQIAQPVHFTSTFYVTRANRHNQIRFLADPTGAFTKAMDMSFGEAAAIFGGDRSKRYAVVVKDGKVASVSVEPDNTGTTVSLADKVLGSAGVADAETVV